MTRSGTWPNLHWKRLSDNTIHHKKPAHVWAGCALGGKSELTNIIPKNDKNCFSRWAILNFDEDSVVSPFKIQDAFEGNSDLIFARCVNRRYVEKYFIDHTRCINFAWTCQPDDSTYDPRFFSLCKLCPTSNNFRFETGFSIHNVICTLWSYSPAYMFLVQAWLLIR